MRNIVVFSGSSHPALALEICNRLAIPLGRVNLRKFSNKETNVEIVESVRDMDVFIISSGCGNVNDNFIELLIMIAACRTASASKITAVIPLFPYARQPETPYKKNTSNPLRFSIADASKYQSLVDTSCSSNSSPSLIPSQPPVHVLPTLSEELLDIHSPLAPLNSAPDVTKIRYSTTTTDLNTQRISTYSNSQPNISITSLAPAFTHDTSTQGNHYKHWTARSGTLIANMLVAAGTDHIITMDLHDPQFQGLFDIPVDNLYSQPLHIKYIKQKIPNYKNAVVVSPDAGGAKRATLIADKLKMEFALIHAERRHLPSANTTLDVMKLVGDVNGKSCILIDDIADTCITITKAAQVLHDYGATRIVALITHATLSGSAIDRINSSYIDEIIVCNTVPLDMHLKMCSKIKVIDVSGLFAEAIRRIHNGESVSVLFDVVPF